MNKHFIIDGLPESATRYRTGYAVVAIDVIRATTMAITAVAAGRPCFLAPSLDGALWLASVLEKPILAGELDGDMPATFDMNNSPAELSLRSDILRPLVLLSSSGSKLMCNVMGSDAAYVACFRNHSSLSRELVTQGYPRIALLGAGSRGAFREEDLLCCAWIGAELARHGYSPEDQRTLNVLEQWGNARTTDCLISKSVDYLKRTGQLADLDFITSRVNDLDKVFILRGGEVVLKTPTPEASACNAAAHQQKGLQAIVQQSTLMTINGGGFYTTFGMPLCTRRTARQHFLYWVSVTRHFLRTFPSKRLFAIFIGHGKAFAERGTSVVQSGRSREDC